MADPKDLQRALTIEIKDLTDADLRKADLREAYFRMKFMSGADLRDADLRDVDLAYADLRDADLRDADLRKADLMDAKLEGAKFKGAKIEGAQLSYANLKGADLSGLNLDEAELKYARARGAKFMDSWLKGTKFKGADLRGADLRGADLTNARFTDANLEGADLRGADLTDIWIFNANLEDVRGIPLTISDEFSHQGETVEEKLRRDSPELRKELKRLKGEILRASDLESIEEVIDDIMRVRTRHLPWARADKNEGEIDYFFPLLEEARLKAIKDLKFYISKAKSDKELEDLAPAVGSLQAQPEYVKEYKRDLEDLQEEIEEKYSVVGKGMRFLKKLFRRGRRASQIRTASQMLNQLNKEISDLKREL
jgi:uncharacterized protein YjbI with pentapeptide repeats